MKKKKKEGRRRRRRKKKKEEEKERRRKKKKNQRHHCGNLKYSITHSLLQRTSAFNLLTYLLHGAESFFRS
jgi:hypothetical protein